MGGPALLVDYAALAAVHLRETAPAPTTRCALMAAYHMGWVDRAGRADESAPGKLLRPSLCLWACAAACGDPGPALPLASALEWVHNFTLIHDDILDGDRERRHRETVWSVWGPAQGINAGDAVHALAFELLLAPGRGSARRLAAGHLLARTIRRIIEGQCLDVAMEGQLRAEPSAYLRMARAKTGALLGASLEGGALIGGSPRGVARRLGRAGELLGLAFQVRDDWLGVWGEPARTGKSRDCDLQRRKVTYPVIAGYTAMASCERRRFRAAFAARRGESAVAEMRALLEQRAAGRLTSEAAARFAGEAAGLIAGCGLPAASVQQFEGLARYVADRQA